jgi:hypothetical protein
MAIRLGTPGADALTGTDDSDALFGFGGDDLLEALGGTDAALVGAGDASIVGDVFGGPPSPRPSAEARDAT